VSTRLVVAVLQRGRTKMIEGIASAELALERRAPRYRDPQRVDGAMLVELAAHQFLDASLA